MRDNLRPSGTVEITCKHCGWSFWVDALDPRLPNLDCCDNCAILFVWTDDQIDAELFRLGIDPNAMASRGLDFIVKLRNLTPVLKED